MVRVRSVISPCSHVEKKSTGKGATVMTTFLKTMPFYDEVDQRPPPKKTKTNVPDIARTLRSIRISRLMINKKKA